MSTFRKINNWLHLWLGLISGIIVFIVCLTGCVWIFNEEIDALLEPETNIAYQDKPVLIPSEIKQIANNLFPDKKVSYAYYMQDRAVEVAVGEGRRGNITLKINPYTGEVIKTVVRKKGEIDFFRWVLNGHRFLWLPASIGRPIVNYGTLVFVILLITGLIWWYPKKWSKSTREKSFKIKWGASFKRLNLDLHNVLGFYSLLFLLVIALTGMVWGIEWYSKGLYWVTTGGNSLPERGHFESDTTKARKYYTPDEAMDKAWATVVKRHSESKGFYYTFPNTSKAKSVINITIYPSKGQFYNNQSYTFDQHTLKQIPRGALYDTEYAKAPVADKIRRMNYDLHVGSILGFPGKVLAFLVTLVGASLPITGFIVWWGRGKKSKKKVVATPIKSQNQSGSQKRRVKLNRPVAAE